MFVDIEMFSEDPMDNVISCLKFKFDKIIFLGFSDESMDVTGKNTTARFLQSSKIGVRDISFVALPEADYAEIERIILETIQAERSEGNECYFDLTGGDEVALAAVGAIAKQYSLPMHEVDILEDELRILSMPEKYDELPKRNIYIGIEEFLNLHEAVIDRNRYKAENQITDTIEYRQKVTKLYKHASSLGKKWNRIAAGMARLCARQHLHVYRGIEEIGQAARAARMNTKSFMEEIRKLFRMGLFQTFEYNGSILRIEFSSELDQALVSNPGSILEHYTYCKVKGIPDVNECAVGYCLNWEGEGNPDYIDRDGDDVVNEVDVIFMRKNVPTFISCKNKQVTDNQPLYELETVADRFGGANVRKVLMAQDGATLGVKNRAEEMGIKLVTRFNLIR